MGAEASFSSISSFDVSIVSPIDIILIGFGERKGKREILTSSWYSGRIGPVRSFRSNTMLVKIPGSQTAASQEGANDRSHQTRNTESGCRGDGDGCSAARACSAGWAGRHCHVLLRNRVRSHPLSGGRLWLP